MMTTRPIKYDVKRKPKQDKMDDSPTNVIFHNIEKHADEEILNELSAVGDTLEQMAWKCGWLVNELYVNLLANKYQVDYLMVCYYVSVVRLRGQRKMNTVKKWALTARFFPRKVAEHYGSLILPFSHFTYAATFDDQKDRTGKPIWQSVLEYSWARYTDEHGYASHASVAELEREFEGKKIVKSTRPVTNLFTPGLASSSSAALPEVDMDDGESELEGVAEERIALNIIQDAVGKFVDTVGNVLPRVSLSYPSIAAGVAAILSLMGNLKQALKSIAVNLHDNP